MKAEDNEFPYVTMAEQGSDVATPGAGLWRLYYKADGLYLIDDAGTVVGPLGPGGGLAFSGAKVKYASNKTVVSGWSFLPGWDAEVFDTDGYHDNTTNNTRFTVPATGYYLLHAHVDFPSAVSAQLAIGFVKNTDAASSPIAGVRGDTGNSFGVQAAGVAPLTAGDYVQVATYISAGTPTLTAADCGASIIRLG